MRQSLHIFEKILLDQSSQPLIENNLRGVFAEYLITDLLGVGWFVRPGSWELWDIDGSHGERIEVKSSAYLQSWCEWNMPEGEFRISKPSFSIKAPKETAWYGKILPHRRPSDVYIFALHAIKDLATADQRDPTQWKFYVVKTSDLPEGQKTIGLAALSKLANPVSDQALKAEVEEIFLSISSEGRS